MRVLILSLILMTAAATAAETLIFDVDGVQREALVLAPKQESGGPAPLVFLFHGHGGRAAGILRRYDIQAHWPEAIVVAPQGLPTAGRYDPESQESGWLARNFDGTNRDLQFFDALLARMRNDFDVGRVYASGHSNGGGFTYFVAAERPGTFSAIAPSASTSLSSLFLEPMPVLHIAGKQDDLVSVQAQRRMIGVLQQINECSMKRETLGAGCHLCASDKNTPLVVCVHDGGHRFTPQHVPMIVEFFKTFATSNAQESISRP